MADIKALDGEKALFQLAAITLPSGAQAQAIVLVGADGQPVQSWPLPQNAATEDGQEAVAAAVASIAQAIAAGVSVTNFPAAPSDYPSAATVQKVEAVRALLAAGLSVNVGNFPATQQVAGSVNVGNLPADPLTNTQLRAAPVPAANTDDSFLVRWVLKPLARLTFTTTGLRIDAGGSSVTASIAASQTLATVTNVAGLGFNSQLGQSCQQSNVAFQTGFRRNLVVS